jgi:hypothetical protein
MLATDTASTLDRKEVRWDRSAAVPAVHLGPLWGVQKGPMDRIKAVAL